MALKDPQSIRESDLTIVERCVPAHMLVLMLEQVMKAGFDMRADVFKHLQVAAIAPLAKCDDFTVARLARIIDSHATALLRELSPDDPREGLYTCAMFCLLLVEEGRLPDAGNQAVLVSLMLIDDIRDDRPDAAGQGVVWHLKEERWKKNAKRMLHRATLLGL